MKSNLDLLRKGLASEFLKHRSSFMFWFVLLVPFLITLITFLTVLSDDQLSVVDPWRWYIIFNYKPYFHIFVFLQILFVSHVNYIEHKNKTWKNLRVLPISFWAFFLSKPLFSWLILTINLLLFYFLVMMSGHWLGLLRPDLGFQHNSYWFEAFVPSCKFLIASFCSFAVIHWASSYFHSIIVSFVIGLIGYASGFALFLVTSRSGYKGYPYSKWHPFNFSGYAFESFGTGNHSLNVEYVYYGLAGGIVILLLHYVSSRYKNVI